MDENILTQMTLGSLGRAVGTGVPAVTWPFRSGPRHCGQSAALDSLSSNSCGDQVKYSVLSVSLPLLLQESKSEARGERTEKSKPINPLSLDGGGLRRASLEVETRQAAHKTERDSEHD